MWAQWLLVTEAMHYASCSHSWHKCTLYLFSYCRTLGTRLALKGMKAQRAKKLAEAKSRNRIALRQRAWFAPTQTTTDMAAKGMHAVVPLWTRIFYAQLIWKPMLGGEARSITCSTNK